MWTQSVASVTNMQHLFAIRGAGIDFMSSIQCTDIDMPERKTIEEIKRTQEMKHANADFVQRHNYPNHHMIL